ncbi:MAG: GDP-L-fucose synthase family protein [bacterium]
MNKTDKIYVPGHSGLVGKALLGELHKAGYHNIVCKDIEEMDLRDQRMVAQFFDEQRPEYVFLLAARVGGIQANNVYQAEFIYDNLMIEANVIHNAYHYGVKKLLFLGSSCIYPKFALQPMKEEYLLTGPLEPTNDAYAIAKIAGIKMCHAYRKQYNFNCICAMPTNLYGPHDYFNLHNSHVLPALLRRFHEAKLADSPTMSVWGSGKPTREFLFVHDLAGALIFLMENYNEPDIINIGTGKEITIAEVAYMIKEVVGFKGQIHFDTEKPDGTPRKLLDVSRINALGWKAEVSLEEGMRKTYQWFCDNYDHIRE